jgi:aspartyl-tRNA(Asn)/glutamyl-tRNA(Gln) amidotransferase subunit B
MEEGSLRCDVNVSIRPKGQEKLGTRTELKNMNSFRNVEKAAIYEIERQKQVISAGGKIVQQTLLWDSNKMVTRMMRSKEEAHDYRYFPEPDIPAVIVTEQMLAEIKAELPEMPDVRKGRFMSQMGLPEFDSHVLTESRYMADYFEETLTYINSPKPVANIIIGEVRRVLNEQSIDIREFTITPARLADLVKLRESNAISSSAMQTIFNAMLEDEGTAEALAQKLNLVQVSDTSVIEPVVDSTLAQYPDKVEQYRSGKIGLLGFFVGQVMRETGGQANPELVRNLVTSKLEA